jgi:hypothetical protein
VDVIGDDLCERVMSIIGGGAGMGANGILMPEPATVHANGHAL